MMPRRDKRGQFANVADGLLALVLARAGSDISATR